MMAPTSSTSGVNLTQKHIHTHHTALRQSGLTPQGIVSTHASAKVIASSPSFAAIERDLRGEADTLRKELVRKDNRNDSLTKELQEIRTSHSSAQRELRNLTGTFDKLNTERHTLTNALQKSKVSNNFSAPNRSQIYIVPNTSINVGALRPTRKQARAAW